MGKNFRNAFLMRVEGDGDDTGGSGDNDQSGNKGFPDGTPVADMTPEQQVAYWKDKARKHEDRAKSAIRPDEHQKLKDELEAMKSASLSDQEKAIEDAKAEARSAGESAAAERYQRELVSLKLQIATGQDEATLKYLDHKAFLTDSGEVDTDKVSEYAANAGPQKSQRQLDAEALGSMDAGKRGSHDGGKPSVESGRERFRNRHHKSKID